MPIMSSMSSLKVIPKKASLVSQENCCPDLPKNSTYSNWCFMKFYHAEVEPRKGKVVKGILGESVRIGISKFGIRIRVISRSGNLGAEFFRNRSG